MVNIDEVRQKLKDPKHKFAIVTISEDLIKMQSELDIVELRQLIVTLPKTSFENEIMKLHTNQEIASVKNEIAKIEANTTLAISRDESLKNQTQRDAKLLVDLQTNYEYNKLKDQLSDLQFDKDLYEGQARYHENLWKGIMKIYSERLNILFSDKKVMDSE